MPSTDQQRPRLVTTAAQLRAETRRARKAGRKVGVVPTMGALHAGHLSLVEASVAECDFTVVTIFVNRTQFGPQEDFSKYPRTLEADLTALAPYPVDVVFAPPEEEIYRPGHATYVEVESVTKPLEGVFRPTHFRGVTTIVLKLFNLVTPDVAYFGRKDYQQCLVVRRMVEDLDLPIEIRICPIVREADGLALSSRNVYLSPDQRRDALVLSRALQRAAELVDRGERDPAVVLRGMQDLFDEVPHVTIDYLALVDPDTLEPVTDLDRPAVAAIAARVGTTRLIDNAPLGEARRS